MVPAWSNQSLTAFLFLHFVGFCSHLAILVQRPRTGVAQCLRTHSTHGALCDVLRPNRLRHEQEGHGRRMEAERIQQEIGGFSKKAQGTKQEKA